MNTLKEKKKTCFSLYERESRIRMTHHSIFNFKLIVRRWKYWPGAFTKKCRLRLVLIFWSQNYLSANRVVNCYETKIIIGCLKFIWVIMIPLSILFCFLFRQKKWFHNNFNNALALSLNYRVRNYSALVNTCSKKSIFWLHPDMSFRSRFWELYLTLLGN